MNSERHQQTSWVQYIELNRENWYAPITIGDPTAFWQIDVIVPQEKLPTPSRRAIGAAMARSPHKPGRTRRHDLLQPQAHWDGQLYCCGVGLILR